MQTPDRCVDPKRIIDSLLLCYDANTEVESVIKTFTISEKEEAQKQLELHRKYGTGAADFFRLVSIADFIPKASKEPTAPVMIVFTQEGEHIHSWETDVSGMNIQQMLESAFDTGLVDESIPLEFIAYDDSQPEGVEVVLMKGTIEPAMF